MAAAAMQRRSVGLIGSQTETGTETAGETMCGHETMGRSGIGSGKGSVKGTGTAASPAGTIGQLPRHMGPDRRPDTCEMALLHDA